MQPVMPRWPELARQAGQAPGEDRRGFVGAEGRDIWPESGGSWGGGPSDGRLGIAL